jgi:hypothetical protein
MGGPMKALLGAMVLAGSGWLFVAPRAQLPEITNIHFVETAKSADEFVDSAGVNVHLHYTDTPYADFPSLERALKELGVRHIRDGMVDTKWQLFYERLNELGRQGIKATLITSPKLADNTLASYPNRVKESLEAYEAPNEYDQSGDPNWAQTLNDYVVKLHQIVKQNPQTAAFPIIGPSLTKTESFAKVADCGPYIDYGNLHNYFAGRNPGTKGWGSNGYGSLEWDLALASKTWPGKSVVTTETGYRNDEDNPQGVPEDISGKYLPRLLLEQFAHGIQKTYLYELVDLGAKKPLEDRAFGLLNGDYSPKPAFNALKSLFQLLSDPGPKFAPRVLKFALSGELTNVHHLLLEKRDGKFFLAIWVEEPGYDVSKKMKLAIEPRQLSVRFAEPAKVRVHNFDANYELQSTALKTGQAQNIEVNDQVTVLEIQR